MKITKAKDNFLTVYILKTFRQIAKGDIPAHHHYPKISFFHF
ncbi:hypothetical protein N499_0413 [Wolbachia pipientis wVitA]|nr:hypothetical protein N499_0413 [Wolbachia pipientis wVitA]